MSEIGGGMTIAKRVDRFVEELSDDPRVIAVVAINAFLPFFTVLLSTMWMTQVVLELFPFFRTSAKMLGWIFAVCSVAEMGVVFWAVVTLAIYTLPFSIAQAVFFFYICFKHVSANHHVVRWSFFTPALFGILLALS